MIIVRTPVVSCIIIFYNEEQFLAEAVESVLAQGYQSWELLLTDDGSTDNSPAIAKGYESRHPGKIRYLEHYGHKNCGMSATRNLGIQHATGEYVAFLDADDVWLPTKLEQQVAILEKNLEVGMVYGRSLYWGSWNEERERKSDHIPIAYVPGDTIYQPHDLLTLTYPLGSATPPPPTDVMLRRAAILEVGGFEEGFDKIFQLYEDQAFFVKLYLRFPVFVSNHCWDRYRLHADSCCSVVQKSGRYDQVRLYFLNWFEDYLNREKITDTEVWSSLNAAMLPYQHPILFTLRRLASRGIRMGRRLTKNVVQGKRSNPNDFSD